MRPVRFTLLVTIVGTVLLTWTGARAEEIRGADAAGIAIGVRSRATIVLSSSVAPGFVAARSLGETWSVGLADTLREAGANPQRLYVVWQDRAGVVRRLEYDIGHPFILDFSEEEWVRETRTLDNGSVVIAVTHHEVEVFCEVSPPAPATLFCAAGDCR